MTNIKPKCWGWFANCTKPVPDGLSEDGSVLYWKISCDLRHECFLDWKSKGGPVCDTKLLEEAK